MFWQWKRVCCLIVGVLYHIFTLAAAAPSAAAAARLKHGLVLSAA
jgi:hypothetical protein